MSADNQARRATSSTGKRSRQPYAWLGAGALSLGVGAAFRGDPRGNSLTALDIPKTMAVMA